MEKNQFWNNAYFLSCEQNEPNLDLKILFQRIELSVNLTKPSPDNKPNASVVLEHVRLEFLNANFQPW